MGSLWPEKMKPVLWTVPDNPEQKTVLCVVHLDGKSRLERTSSTAKDCFKDDGKAAFGSGFCAHATLYYSCVSQVI